MKNLLLITLLVSSLLCGGCSTLFKATVTLTEVVDVAMKNWASLSVAGKSTPAIDAKVKEGHAIYAKSAAVARDALIAFKATGDKAAYEQALQAVKVAVLGILDTITPILTADKALTLRSQTAKASTL